MKFPKSFFLFLPIFLLLLSPVYASSDGRAYIFPAGVLEDYDLYFVAGGFFAAVVVGIVVFAVVYLKRSSDSE